MNEQQSIESDLDDASNFGKGVALVLSLAFLLVVLLWCATARAQTPTFTATITQGPAPLATTLTWSVPGATACTAGGAGSVPTWSGSVPVSGTRNLSGIAVDMTLTLACTGPGKATLSWTAPTTNTDGTALTNLAGYTVLYGASASQLTQSVALNVPGATAYTIDPIAAGSYAFAVRAKNAAGAESANSNAITKAIAGLTYSGSVAIDVTAVPSAPTGLVVTEVTAFDWRLNPDGTLLATRLPLTPLSISCAGLDCTVLARRQ